MPLAYDKYTELLSAIINGKATAVQIEQVKNFEAAQPEKCPHCGAPVRGIAAPTNRIVHDITNCPRQKKPETTRPRFSED